MIPKIIHQIWFQGQDQLPKKYDKNIQTIKSNHPNWTYKLWDDIQIRKIIPDKYLDMYNSYQYMHQKIDFAKYVILYEIGGVYLDIDVVSVRPLDKLLDDFKDKELIVGNLNMNQVESFVLCYESSCINNGIIISSQYNEIMKKIIEACDENKDYVWYNPRILLNLSYKLSCINSTTGPFLFNYVIKKNPSDKTLILPPEYLEPCRQTDCSGQTENTYTLHEHELSWQPEIIKNIAWFYIQHPKLTIGIVICFIILLTFIINFIRQKK